MAPTALRAVAHAKAAQTTVAQPSARPPAPRALPNQLGRLAAAVLANAGAARLAIADELSLPELSLPELSLPEVSLPAIDAEAASGLGALLADNAPLVGGVALLLAVPLVLNRLLAAGGDEGAKPTSVERTLQALADDPRVLLVDVRSRAEAKAQGAPDLRAVKRKALSLPLTSLVKGELVLDEAFAAKFAKLPGVSEESLVIFLDGDGVAAAKRAAAEVDGAVAKTYFVAGGAEAWAEEGPWRAPSKGLSLPDLSQVAASIDALAEDFKAAPTLTKGALAAGAIAGASVLLFNEVEVVLELAGLFAAGNFLLKLVFAEEREKTLGEIKSLVDDKVAIKQVGADLSKIAKAVLEDAPDGAAPPAPQAAPEAAPAAAEAAAELPQNVAEAKAWIGNWKAKA
jgi:chitinase domain-containing protein 1